jgi:hypothetical protein
MPVAVGRQAGREIARQAGLSGVTVAKVRGSLAQSGQIEDPAVRVGARGYTYPAPVLARPPGELPGTGLGEAVGQLFTRGDRRVPVALHLGICLLEHEATCSTSRIHERTPILHGPGEESWRAKKRLVYVRSPRVKAPAS